MVFWYDQSYYVGYAQIQFIDEIYTTDSSKKFNNSLIILSILPALYYLIIFYKLIVLCRSFASTSQNDA